MATQSKNAGNLEKTISITIHGYGGECYIGRVDEEVYSYYKKNRIDIDVIANDSDAKEWSNIPEKYQFFERGCPNECDDLAHGSGANMGEHTFIEIKDQRGNLIWQSDLDPYTLEEYGVSLEIMNEFYSDTVEKSVILYGEQIEKGIFLETKFKIDKPFDPKKLNFKYFIIDNWNFLTAINYNEEEIDLSEGYETASKSSEHKFIVNN